MPGEGGRAEGEGRLTRGRSNNTGDFPWLFDIRMREEWGAIPSRRPEGQVAAGAQPTRLSSVTQQHYSAIPPRRWNSSAAAPF